MCALLVDLETLVQINSIVEELLKQPSAVVASLARKLDNLIAPCFQVSLLNIILNVQKNCNRSEYLSRTMTSFQQRRWPSGKSVCLWSCWLGLNSESSQTNDIKIGIHRFTACRSALKGTVWRTNRQVCLPFS